MRVVRPRRPFFASDDDLLRRVQLPEWQAFVRFLIGYGVLNGVTRLYGPPFVHLAGAHVDFGNAYLQPPHVDIAPVPVQLLLFPSWLAHQALPCNGEVERVVVSFNASVHAAGGSDPLHGYSAA
jgi:hypothetical protein